ncbi:MAG TPA: PQQ-dependent sugar dehydrogenase [Thermohalobaculum sp.]|nr:PQQ-dependent sugar dehydrogenase [Thermohalobaculum sp.]
MHEREPLGGARATAAAVAVLMTLAAVPQACAQPDAVEAGIGTIDVETVAGGLVHPWGLAFLPDGRMLVTERPGRLRVVSPGGELSAPLGGVPDVFAEGQGGLLDVALDPGFAENGLVYLSFAEPGEGGASTAVARGRLAGDRLEGTEVIFRQQPKVGGGAHFGGRLAFAPDGMLFVTMGDRFRFDPAQDLSNHLGTIARINPDGSVPEDNPFVGREGALPEIWSYGHRNVEGAFIHPETGALWVHEMGPRGGDELNVPEAGRNHGWPIVSWGDHYDGGQIPDPPTRPEFADAVTYWNPSISPSGVIHYTGDLFPEWKGDLLIGGLSSQALIRLEIDGQTVTGEERIEFGTRIREVAQGPDGAVYLLTDQPDGEVLRLTPG